MGITTMSVRLQFGRARRIRALPVEVSSVIGRRIAEQKRKDNFFNFCSFAEKRCQFFSPIPGKEDFPLYLILDCIPLLPLPHYRAPIAL